MTARLSDKQTYALSESDSRLNFFMGSIGAGKTFTANLLFAKWLMELPPGDMMITGVSRDTIQRNVVNELFSFLGSPPPSPKATSVKILGRNLFLVGAKDDRSVSVIQGANLVAAYSDEMVKSPKAFFKMLQGRCRKEGAKMLCTGNPEGPNHWVKKEYIDNKDIELKHISFLLDDNHALDPKFKAAIKKEYTGVWYKRLILGEWASADGMIYDTFDEENIFDGTYDRPSYYVAGIDYGSSNATCCLLAAISPYGYPKVRIVKEYYYDAKKTGIGKTDGQLGVDIYNFLKDVPNLKYIYVDPSALSIRLELETYDLPVVPSDNDVLLGIQRTSSMIQNKNILVHKECKNLIDSIYSYVWDQKASDRGEDKPVKEFDHAADALKYIILGEFKNGESRSEREEWTAQRWHREVNSDYSFMEMLERPC